MASNFKKYNKMWRKFVKIGARFQKNVLTGQKTAKNLRIPSEMIKVRFMPK